MNRPETRRIAVTIACLMASNFAFAQVYSWKDAISGASRFSNIAPPGYSTGEIVSGPRVIATVGGRVVDDTALPYEERLLLSGKSKEYIEKLRLQKQMESSTPQSPPRESRVKADAEAGKTYAPGAASASSPANGKKGS